MTTPLSRGMIRPGTHRPTLQTTLLEYLTRIHPLIPLETRPPSYGTAAINVTKDFQTDVLGSHISLRNIRK